MSETRMLHIDGARISDIPSFYAEINRVFMANESWYLAQSLDALDDMLYGSYGALQGEGPVTVVWSDMKHSQAALGVDTTRALLLERLTQRATFNGQSISEQLEKLDSADGKTYFDIVLDVFASHSNVHLVPG